MSTYLWCYIALHGLIMASLGGQAIGFYFRLLRMEPITNGKWNQNYARAKIFFSRALISFVMALIGEGLGFTFLWLGGAFN